ncbi:MAG: hypothetical protein QOC55_2064 [Thermoleophilaceae bacterium]|jgi:hypothetical protein|nr:hypothetical protein [Thermoleophilaceae bacterium]
MTTPAAGGLDFDRNRLSQGELIAGVSGLALFLFLFLHWFYGASAWSTFDVIDFVLAAIALLAVAVAVAKAVGSDLLGQRAGLVLTFLGTVATSMILTFVLEGNGRKIGLWLAFLAAIGLMYGGWRVLSESMPGLGSLGRPGGAGGGAAAPASSAAAPTTPMPATSAGGTPGVPGGGAAGVSPGKEGPGAPHPGTSTGAPGEEGGGPTPAAAGADAIPGQNAPSTPPGIAGEPPAQGGTQAPGL